MNTVEVAVVSCVVELFVFILLIVLIIVIIVLRFDNYLTEETESYCNEVIIKFTEEEKNIISHTTNLQPTLYAGNVPRPLLSAMFKIRQLGQYLCCPSRLKIRELDHWFTSLIVVKHFKREHRNLCARIWWWLCCCGCFCLRMCCRKQQCRTNDNRTVERYGIAMWHKNSQTLVLNFRSTSSLSHWETDLRFHQMYPSILNGRNKNMLLHTGVNKVFEDCITGIRQLVITYNPKFIIITGHSLGGAISTEVAADLACLPHNHEPIPILCCTFGQLRIGNKDFTNHLDSLVLHPNNQPKGFNPLYYIRVANTEDIICDLPYSQNHIPCIIDASYSHPRCGGLFFTRSMKTLAENHTHAYEDFVFRPNLHTCQSYTVCE